MMVSNRGSVFRLLFWQWKNVLIFAFGGAVAYVLYVEMSMTAMKLPTIPLAVVGAALGIFVSFRTNSAYDRWWEGRKLWGRMINTSRHFCTQVVSYVGSKDPTDESRDAVRQLVYRHIAYVHVFRCLLRQQDPYADPDVKEFLTEGEFEAMQQESNATHALLQRQSDQLTRLSDEEQLDPFRLQRLDESIMHLLDIQGGCERIKKTPMPRGYAFIANRLVMAFAFLFPLAVIEHLGVWTIPINVLVCLSFALINEAGRVLEDPFTMFWNGLPLSNISKMIEVNLRQRLGETELPEIPGVNEKGILM